MRLKAVTFIFMATASAFSVAAQADIFADFGTLVKAGSASDGCISNAVSDDYFSNAKSEVGESKWLRDTGEISLVLAHPLKLDAQSPDMSSSANLSYQNGIATTPQTGMSVGDSRKGAVCTFEILYSNEDFDSAYNNQKLANPYPVLFLATNVQGSRSMMLESWKSDLPSQLPGGRCPIQRQITESQIKYDFSNGAPLTYADGRQSESRVLSMTCRGFNMKLKDVTASMGQSIAATRSL